MVVVVQNEIKEQHMHFNLLTDGRADKWKHRETEGIQTKIDSDVGNQTDMDR